MPYTPLATADDDLAGEEESSLPSGPKYNVFLSASDKWRLVRPLLVRYMLPLCKSSIHLSTPADMIDSLCVHGKSLVPRCTRSDPSFQFEYTINQVRTLLIISFGQSIYPLSGNCPDAAVPGPIARGTCLPEQDNPLRARLLSAVAGTRFSHLSLAHPPMLVQLVYQTTVFLSRSSISIGIPPLPASLLSLPAILQALILVTLAFESAVGIFPSGPGTADSEAWSITVVFLLISLEGICGGSA